MVLTQQIRDFLNVVHYKLILNTLWAQYNEFIFILR